MKKAKIMLLSIGVLAAVGGTLAFKANAKRSQDFCILTTVGTPANKICTSSFTLSKTTLLNQPGFTWYYTITDNTINCTLNIIKCTTSTKVTID